MTEREDNRPDPDLLLNLIKKEESRKERKKGYLKIFLGYVAGVGKTYRMLYEARNILEKGEDVIAGIVETHNRKETESLLEKLPLLPAKKIDYRGLLLQEMDLDAIIERKPACVLVDELAHTNVPGSRHAKRYRDVEELLEHGINVYTTVNIQHIESLNEIIYQITGVKVKETVPDRIFEMADKIELVDIPVEEQLQRLKEGKVYIPEKAGVAAENFFKEGNLLALRELALRYTATRVDEAMLNYRELHKINLMWQAGSRLLVCVSPSPTSEYLVRLTRRYADELRCEWYAVYVESPLMANLTSGQKEVLEKNLHLAETLGARVVKLTGIKSADEVISFAKSKNITLIILGYTRRTYLERLFRGSIMNEIIEKSDTIQVLLVDSRGAIPPDRKNPPERMKNRIFLWKPYVISFLMIAMTALICYHTRFFQNQTDLSMIFLVPVIYSSVIYGFSCGIFSSLLAVLSFDFFFVKPFYTFTVSDIKFITTFIVIFSVGIFTGMLAEIIRRQNEFARKRQRDLSTLYHFTRDILSYPEEVEILNYAVNEISNLFNIDAIILLPDKDNDLQVTVKNKNDIFLDEQEINVARWVFIHGKTAGAGTETLSAINWRFVPLKVKHDIAGVLAISSSSEKFDFSREEESLLDSITLILSLALVNNIKVM